MLYNNYDLIGEKEGIAKVSEEIEKAFLLAEYVALREEILSRTGRQTQITTLSVGILGALLAVIPIKVFSASQTIPVNDLNNPLVITALLIVSGLFTSLLWVFMEQEMRVTNAAYYIHNSIRVRAALLLKFSKNDNNELVWDKELGILNWDKYLIQTSQPEDVVSWLIFLIRVFSRYVVMAIPALIALFAALLIYVSKPPFHKEVIINVINQVFFFCDLLYFISAVLFAALYMKRLQYNVLRSPSNIIFPKSFELVKELMSSVDKADELPINNKGIPTILEERQASRKNRINRNNNRTTTDTSISNSLIKETRLTSNEGSAISVNDGDVSAMLEKRQIGQGSSQREPSQKSPSPRQNNSTTNAGSTTTNTNLSNSLSGKRTGRNSNKRS